VYLRKRLYDFGTDGKGFVVVNSSCGNATQSIVHGASFTYSYRLWTIVYRL